MHRFEKASGTIKASSSELALMESYMSDKVWWAILGLNQ
jgi:hypothetical protein